MDTDLENLPVSGPAVWQAEDLAANQDWVQTFSDLELEELHEALLNVESRSLEAPEFGADDFPLPTLAGRFQKAAQSLETGCGCLLLKGFNPDRYSLTQIKIIYWGLGLHFGTPVTQNAAGDLIGNVRNSGRSSTEKNVRGYTTRNSLRPHCDPSDVVTLLCVSTALSGGRSQLSSASAIYNEIRATHPEYLPCLMRGFHYDLRGEGPSGDADEVTENRLATFSWHQGKLSCRFNARSIIDGQRKYGEPLSDLELAAVRCVESLAEDDRFRYDMDFNVGDIQILNNYSILHSRSAFEDDAKGGRHLLRLWLNLDPQIARPLDSAFANKNNTGPRGGIHVHENHAGWVP